MTAYLSDNGWVIKIAGFEADVDRAIESEVRAGRPTEELVEALRDHDVAVQVLVRNEGGDR